MSPGHGGRAQGGWRVSTRSRRAGRDQGGGGGGVPVPAQPLRPGRRVQGGQRQRRQPPAHLHLPVSVTCEYKVDTCHTCQHCYRRGYRGNALVRCRRGECFSDSECPAHLACFDYRCKDPCKGPDTSCGDNANCKVDITLHYLHYLHHLQGVRFVMI